MGQSFNPEEAKKFLLAKETQEKQHKEEARKTALERVCSFLRQEFQGTSVEVYLIGSILKPHSFSSRSDIDIVLKNYKQDRFDFWARCEKQLDYPIEVILFEKCPFQDFVLKQGFKVV